MFVATRSAIPGELRSRRTRVRFTDHGQFLLLLSLCQLPFPTSCFASVSGSRQFPPAVGHDGFSAAFESVFRRDAADGAVQPQVVVIRHKIGHDSPSIFQAQWRAGTDAVALQRRMPALLFAVRLRVERRGPDMGHAAEPDEPLEIPGDALGAAAADDPWFHARETFSCALQGDPHAGLGH